jgi:hypothetical protein
MEQNQGLGTKAGLSHDAMDALVATVLGWYERHFKQQAETPSEDIAFSDEWERRQIARELHWN